MFARNRSKHANVATSAVSVFAAALAKTSASTTVAPERPADFTAADEAPEQEKDEEAYPEVAPAAADGTPEDEHDEEAYPEAAPETVPPQLRRRLLRKTCATHTASHCHKKPRTVRVAGREATRWFFETAAPCIPEELMRFSMTERGLDAETTFEAMCLAFERAYAGNPDGVLCECCQSPGCEVCKHATGWHICDSDREALAADLREDQEPMPRWNAGTLHAGKLDIHNTLWTLPRRLVTLEVLKDAC